VLRSEGATQTLLTLLLGGPQPAECDTLPQWLPLWRAASRAYGRHGAYVAAIAAAVRADRMAWAFFSGNQGAVQAAFPGCLAGGEPRIASFCANETGRKITAIDTSLHMADGMLRLQGRKSWVLADVDDLDLYVLARAAGGPASGPGSLAIVRVPCAAPGVQIGSRRPQDAVPELSHCEVSFTGVSIESSQLIEGDGYADHARPFRLREDIFVTGCTLAYLLAQGHGAGWPTRWRQRCIAVIVTLGQCASLAACDPPTELLAAGALSLAGEVIEQADPLWSQSESAASARWLRDKPILGLGKEARRQRAVSAWARMGVVQNQ